MTKYALGLIADRSREKSQSGNLRRFSHIRLKYNTHIEKSCWSVCESDSYINVLSIIPPY